MSAPLTQRLTDPHQALAMLLDRLEPVDVETVQLSEAVGRVLAQPVRADRPSPPADVSAMDGYAVRLSDLGAGRMDVAGEGAIGRPPPALPPGQAVRVVTGGGVPAGAEAVIPREQVREMPSEIDVPVDPTAKPGAFIRRQGENLCAGETVIEPGAAITPATVSALAAFGVARPRVYRKPRVGLIVTGDELLQPEAEPSPWQLRDSNGPQLHALLTSLPWTDVEPPMHVRDQPHAVQSALHHALKHCDAVCMTGGVSMGDYDYVPAAIEAVGGEIVFHKLAQRPGKPTLGAVGPAGQGGRAILGLPGNPVSVLSVARRMGAVVMRKLAGYREPQPLQPTVRLNNPDDERLAMWWSRPVRLRGTGEAELLPSMSSGDIVCTARADGFVLIPPDEGGAGPWPYYDWSFA